jgi:hypothetical protein
LDESPLAGHSVGQQDCGCEDQKEFRQPSPDRRLCVGRSNLLCTAACGRSEGEEPLGSVRPSCGGGTGGLRRGASRCGRRARARHASSCFGRTGGRD